MSLESLPSPRSFRPASGAIDATLRSAARRIRALLLLRYVSLTLCVTAPLCLLIVGLSKARLFDTPNALWLGLALGLALLVAAIVAFLRPLPELDIARLTERRANLQERLSSAVEFRRMGLSEPFADAQRADAERYASEIDLRALYPVRLPRTLPLGLLAALATFAALILPSLPAFWSPQHRQEMEEVKKQGITIEKLAKDTQKNADTQKLDETRKAAVEARKLGEAMRKGQLSKKQSLVALQKLTKKMEESQQKLAASLAPKPMDQARAEFKRSMDQMERETEAAQRKREEAMRQAAKNQAGKKNDGNKDGEKDAGKERMQSKPKPESEAMKQARKALEQMQQALQNESPQQMQQAMNQMAQQMQSGQLSKEETQQMAQAMMQLSQALKNSSQNAASQMLQQLAQQMMQNANSLDPNTLQQMAQMMQKIGQQMGKGMGDMKGLLDMKALQALAQALKEGRLTMAMGACKNGKTGSLFRMKGAGSGWNGYGDPTKPMKDPGDKAKARLLAMGKGLEKPGVGKTGSAQELAKYMSMTAKGSRSKYLPNGKIAGSRLVNGQELQQNMTGDPDPYRSSSPYYQAFETNRRAAENALDKENIPAAYKQQVRDYFDSIKP